LVVSEFSNGGGVSTIKAYAWAAAATGPLSGDGGCIDSNLNPDPKTGGCNGLPISTSNSDCKITGGGDSLCATTNAHCTDATLACGKPWNDTVATPWLTSDATLGVGKDQIVSPDFYEGGIDVTTLFGQSGTTAPSCFNTIVPDTRSAASITATLFDFVTAQIGECHSSTVTSPVDAATAGTTDAAPASTIPADPNDAKVEVKDKTTVTVSGLGSFAGSISWHICGPTATSSTQLCDGTTGNVGVDLGSQSITASGTYYSPTATVTSAGRYCFRAEFTSTTTGVPPSSDSRATECFTVAPRQPTLTTQATAGPVTFGSKISDTVTLSNTAHKPGTGGPTGSNGTINPTTLGGDATGAITVVAYGPDSCSTVAFTSGAIAASGDGSYGGAGTAFEFTPSAPGQYVFVAAYAGDLPNTLDIAASACSGAPASEKVTVQQIPTDIKTKQSWYPNDTATVCSGTCTLNVSTLGSGGTLDFYLYTNATCSAGTNNANLLYSERIALTGGNATEEKSTKNYPGGNGTPVPTTATPAGTGGSFVAKQITTAYADAAGSSTGSYSWLVKYTPPSTDHTGSTSACETFSTTYTNDPGH
jgi:hypothetical protein